MEIIVNNYMIIYYNINLIKHLTLICLIRFCYILVIVSIRYRFIKR